MEEKERTGEGEDKKFMSTGNWRGKPQGEMKPGKPSSVSRVVLGTWVLRATSPPEKNKPK